MNKRDGLSLTIFIVLLTLKVSGLSISWWMVFATPLIIFGIIVLLGYLSIIFTDNKIEEDDKSWNWDDR